jgi:hypothetical protein
MVEAVQELKLTNAKLPAVVNGSARAKFRDDFFILCICHVEIWGSRHTIMSKRTSAYKGKKVGMLLRDPGPGVMLHIHGGLTRVELLTFGDGDILWHCLASRQKVIMPGERYEILAGRKDGQGFIYVNGYPCVDFANTLSSDQEGLIGGVSQGDINCDQPLYLGVTHFSETNFWLFDGDIEFLGIYNDYELPTGLRGYPPRKTWMTSSEFMERIPPNTKRVFSMQDLGFKVKEKA